MITYIIIAGILALPFIGLATFICGCLQLMGACAFTFGRTGLIVALVLCMAIAAFFII